MNDSTEEKNRLHERALFQIISPYTGSNFMTRMNQRYHLRITLYTDKGCLLWECLKNKYLIKVQFVGVLFPTLYQFKRRQTFSFRLGRSRNIVIYNIEMTRSERVIYVLPAEGIQEMNIWIWKYQKTEYKCILHDYKSSCSQAHKSSFCS